MAHITQNYWLTAGSARRCPPSNHHGQSLDGASSLRPSVETRSRFASYREALLYVFPRMDKGSRFEYWIGMIARTRPSPRWVMGLALPPAALMLVLGLRGSPRSEPARNPSPATDPVARAPETAPAPAPAVRPAVATRPLAQMAPPKPEAVQWEQPGAHFEGEAVRQAERAWRRERVDPRTAPVRETRVRDLFESVDFGEALLGIECRTSLCRIALDATLTQDFDRVRRLAGRVGEHAAVLERTAERIVVLVPGESFDHDTPPRRIPGEGEPPVPPSGDGVEG